MRSKTYSQDYAVSRSPLIRLSSRSGHFEIFVLLLGLVAGTVAGVLFGNFIFGFLALVLFAGLGWILLGLIGSDSPPDPRPSGAESHERQRVPSR
jgi:hypothetical protein